VEIGGSWGLTTHRVAAGAWSLRIQGGGRAPFFAVAGRQGFCVGCCRPRPDCGAAAWRRVVGERGGHGSGRDDLAGRIAIRGAGTQAIWFPESMMPRFVEIVWKIGLPEAKRCG